jgi:hypothetical protein
VLDAETHEVGRRPVGLFLELLVGSADFVALLVGPQ